MDIQQVIREAAARYGQDPTPWLRTAQIESSGNPNDVNARSHAAGLFQFVPRTWAQYGHGGNPLDPAANADAAMRLARDNAAHFQAHMGRAPTPGEVYLMHQQGAGGAEALLRGGNAPASAAVGQQAVLQNGGAPGMTGAQFANKWTSRFDGGAQSTPTQTQPGGGIYTAAGDNSSALSNAFGGAARAMSDAIAQQGQPPGLLKRRQPGDSQFIS